MGQNKWLICSFLSLVLCAIPGGMGMMLGVGLCVICAGGCFAKWLYEEDKYQRAEYEKYLKKLKEKSNKQDQMRYKK